MVGNASSLHRIGRAARRAVEESREKIARCLGARPSEVLFTSGGTESDNLAIKGTYWARRDADPARVRLLVSAIEHHAVLDCVDFLVAHEGAKVTWLEATPDGRVEPETVRAAIETEPGVGRPRLGDVGQQRGRHGAGRAGHRCGRARARGAVPHRRRAGSRAPARRLRRERGRPALGDGAQARWPDRGGGARRPPRRPARAADPRGRPGATGAFGHPRHAGHRRLRHRARRGHGSRWRPRQCGSPACATTSSSVPARPGRAASARPARGSAATRPTGCPATPTCSCPAATATRCSTCSMPRASHARPGSACQAGVPQPSHVLLAMGVSESDARGALRLTLGHTSTAADVDAVIDGPARRDRARPGAHEATAS